MPKHDNEQPPLFDAGNSYDEAWRGMPEFAQKDLTPFKTIYVHFETREEMNAFATLVNQKINLTTQSIWYPEAEIGRYANKRYVDKDAKQAKNENKEDIPAVNKFIRDVEAQAITTKEWIALLNAGNGALSLEEIEALIRERFKVNAIRNLPSGKFDEAMKAIRGAKK